jgi:mitochondrial chaperone BCS1
MWEAFVDALRAQLANQVVAGAVVLALVGVVVTAFRRLPGQIWSQLQRVFYVTAVVDSRNDLFPALILWLNDHRVGRFGRLFAVVQSPSPAVDLEDEVGLNYSPAAGLHFFVHDGHLMWLQREIAMNLQVIETIRVSALFARRSSLEKLFETVLAHANQRRANRLVIYTVDRWGDAWNAGESKPRRSLDSVVLAPGVATQLREDIGEFFSRRGWYAQLGIPWRRGYLLHGPPGTGKTSVAYALASELTLKLCTLSLMNPKLSDHTLAELLQRTPPRSLILLEDIDAFFSARQKQDQRIAISFSGLLNALDGVGAQEGRIVMLTTNHREALDPALIRPGRVDVEFLIGLASAVQLRTLFLRFFPQAQAQADAAVAAYRPQSLSPAQIQQALLASDAPQEAVAALAALGAVALLGKRDDRADATVMGSTADER